MGCIKSGACIGAFIGFLPGIGGAMGDWMAYGSTVASHPNEEFGKGNIRGVIGPEGANNAQKATSMIPTVLFGIPGASFAPFSWHYSCTWGLSWGHLILLTIHNSSIVSHLVLCGLQLLSESFVFCSISILHSSVMCHTNTTFLFL